ncbi:MAG: hypothetical protein EBS01_13610, partial [Verrucomicrobia bacterium]|nr:hypothetical protein [Verrucomicrobiota bacterium]
MNTPQPEPHLQAAEVPPHAGAQPHDSAPVPNTGVLDELFHAAAEHRLCLAIEALESAGHPQEAIAAALLQQDATGSTPWASAVRSGEYSTISNNYLKTLDLQHAVEGKTFLEVCLAHGRDSGDWAVKRLKTKTISRAKLLAPWGAQGDTPLAHILALNNHLRDFVSRLSKPDNKTEATATTTASQDYSVLLESLNTETAALPQNHFGSRRMNLLGSAAAGGHLDQFGESFFSTIATTETLLPANFSPENAVHFLQVAHATGHLTGVPGAVWKRLQRIPADELNATQKALLDELLAYHSELVALYCSKLEADPSAYHREVPPDFKSEPSILAIQRRNDLKRYEENPIPFEHLPQRFQQGEDALASWSKPWIKHLASATFSFDRIPE